MPVRNTASWMIMNTIEVGVAPSALRTPISLVRSLTAIIMMFDTPTTPAASVPRPITITNVEIIQNSFENRSKLSTLFWIAHRLRVLGVELVALGELRDHLVGDDLGLRRRWRCRP